MSNLTTEDILSMTGEIVVFKATLIATEETVRYENEYPDELFDAELRNLVIERAISQLTFQTCNFKCPPEIEDEMKLKEYYDEWFAAEEETRLRKMCYYTIRKELDFRRRPGDEYLSFTDRYIRQVQENQKKLAKAANRPLL